MGKKLKILFSIADLGGGGAERILINILENLNRSNYDVSLFLFERSGVYLSKVPGDVKIKYFINPLSNKIPIFLKSLYRKLCFRVLMHLPDLVHKYFIHEQYDVEVAFLQGITYLLKSNYSKAYKIAWIHTNIDKSEECRYDLQQNLNFADKIVCVSNGVSRALLTNFPYLADKTVVIYNPFDLQKILRQANEVVINYEKPTIIAVGSLHKLKGFDILIMAFAILRNYGYDWQLKILGQGPDFDYFNSLIKSLNLETEIELCGFISNPFPYIKAADVFVLSSRYEGFSNVLVESLCLMTPIVSTNCDSGPSEILDNGKYGYLVPVENCEMLAKGIEAVMTDNNLKQQFIDNAYFRASDFSNSYLMKYVDAVLNV